MGRGHRIIKSGDQTSLRAGNRAGKRQLIMSPIVVETGRQAFLISQEHTESDTAARKANGENLAELKEVEFDQLSDVLKHKYLKGAQVAQDAVVKISKGKGFYSLTPAQKEKAAVAVYDALSKGSPRKRAYQYLSEPKKEEFRGFIEAVGKVEYKPVELDPEPAEAEAQASSQTAKTSSDLVLLKKLMTSLKEDGHFYIGDNKVSGEQAKNYLRALNQKIKAEKVVA